MITNLDKISKYKIYAEPLSDPPASGRHNAGLCPVDPFTYALQNGYHDYIMAGTHRSVAVIMPVTGRWVSELTVVVRVFIGRYI